MLGMGYAPSEAQWPQSPFRQKLGELGWQEGHNIAFERRNAEGRLNWLPDLAAELVRLKPDVIVTGGTPGVRAAQQATTTIPIVIMGAGDLVEQGIVASLAQPGGNTTGVENNPRGLDGKRLEFLKEALPQRRRIAILCNNSCGEPSRETAAQALGLQLLSVAVHHADEFAAAFATIVAYRPEVLFIASDGLLSIHRQQIIDFATTHQLPTVGGERRYAEAGSLLTFGYSLREIQQRAAVYVDKILRGARPEDLPIERAMTFELIINLKTAQALGLTLPPTLLFQATEVIR
jgi:putative ABC transport system substrate-binding protein